MNFGGKRKAPTTNELADTIGFRCFSHGYIFDSIYGQIIRESSLKPAFRSKLVVAPLRDFAIISFPWSDSSQEARRTPFHEKLHSWKYPLAVCERESVNGQKNYRPVYCIVKALVETTGCFVLSLHSISSSSHNKQACGWLV
ncbi:hypothetical protein IV203_037027 [Nitzschia inconspicua]|uniref:Uncharacterized protein n=1 Tax=Nitzschia inconspicua TaxID=303405 RepID=A0A9K3LNX2_9STRA|nr:hypothetical protein IV203_037027 [Nitzschia inconspicua]